MSLQYLTNINPPPTQSLLQYDVEPTAVCVSTATESMYANLTITVYNPTTSPVNCMQFQFGFMVDANSDALTTTADIGNITPVSDQSQWELSSAGWDPINPSLYLYHFEPSGIDEYLPLDANQSLVFHLNQVKIVTGEGIAPFTISETTGDSRADQQTVNGTLPISKTIGSLSIASFDVSPPEAIVPGTPIVLSWKLTGADRWFVFDAEGAVLLYDSTNPDEPNLMSWPVSPQQLTPLANTFYLLVASSGEIFNTRVAAAMVMAAHFLVDPTAQPPTINPSGTSLLHWTTKWASQIKISAPGLETAQFNAPPGQYDIFPGAPGNQFQVQPAYTVPYTLEVAGPGNSQDTKQVMVAVNLPPPSITIFQSTPYPAVVAAGQSVSLTWQSLYGYHAILGQRIRGSEEIINLQNVPLNCSGFPLTPTGISDFILTVFGDQEVTAEITTFEVVQTIPVGQDPNALVFDGEYLWVASNEAMTVTKIDATTNAVIGTYSVPSSPTALAYDGTYVWIGNQQVIDESYGTTVNRLKASDGSNAGSFTVGQGPSALAFDGTNIWVANVGDNTVMKLNPPDGSILATFNVGQGPSALLFDGSFVWCLNAADNTVGKLPLDGNEVIGSYPVGQSPSALTFDGANVWVASPAHSTVTKLRASDGTVLGTYSVGADQSPNLESIAFDGRNIWTGGYNAGGDCWFFVLNLDGSSVCPPITVNVNGYGLFSPTALCFDGNYIWAALDDAGPQATNDCIMKL